jgi:hypothetical protein
MYTAALFTTAKIWNQLLYPLTDEWINKKCYIYSVLKENEVARKTGELETINIGEISQTEKSKYHIFSLL